MGDPNLHDTDEPLPELVKASRYKIIDDHRFEIIYTQWRGIVGHLFLFCSLFLSMYKIYALKKIYKAVCLFLVLKRLVRNSLFLCLYVSVERFLSLFLCG